MGGGLLDIGQPLVWSGHRGREGGKETRWSTVDMVLLILYCTSPVEWMEEKLISDQ